MLGPNPTEQLVRSKERLMDCFGYISIEVFHSTKGSPIVLTGSEYMSDEDDEDSNYLDILQAPSYSYRP